MGIFLGRFLRNFEGFVASGLTVKIWDSLEGFQVMGINLGVHFAFVSAS